MTSIGRNAPCPCGSGRKYKQCCLRAEERRRAVRAAREEGLAKALSWLERRYPKELQRALDEQYFAGADRGALQSRLAGARQDLGGLLEANAREWLLTEAKLATAQGDAYAPELVLGPGGPDLTGDERSWVEAVAAAPLGVYETQGVKAGEGLFLRDLPQDGGDPVWVADRVASRTMRVGEVLGARLAEADGAWSFTGALYPFPRVAVPALLAELERTGPGAGGVPEAREARWRAIAGQWLRFLGDAALVEEDASDLLRARPEEARAELRGRFLREALRGFYVNWADEPIPALGGRTPRQAIGTDEGREAVLSLLRTYVEDESRMAARDGREPLDFGFLWDELGLDHPEATK
jgi:hypothetical protein